MSLDESIDKIEVDPKEEASVVEVFQDVLDKLSDVGKKDKLLKFFKLVQDGKFPLHSIAFELFLDIVEWFDKDRFKGYRYFGIERDFFNNLGVLIDGDFKFGVLLLVFVRFLGGDTGNLYRNVLIGDKFRFVRSKLKSR
jgi:hypothetical protein